MPSLYDKLMEKTVQESQHPSALVSHSPLPEQSKPLPAIALPGENIQKPESLKTRKEESPKGRKEEIRKSRKPESQISGNQAIVNARKPENRKVPKYSTQLEEELQIQVSVFAKMHRLKDYEVVQHAIEDYLKSHK